MRYQISTFDRDTLVIIDTHANREICTVGRYEGCEDHAARAEAIANLLNQAAPIFPGREIALLDKETVC
jgi:hypothetical protein